MRVFVRQNMQILLVYERSTFLQDKSYYVAHLAHRSQNARYEESLEFFNKNVSLVQKILGETARYLKQLFLKGQERAHERVEKREGGGVCACAYIPSLSDTHTHKHTHTFPRLGDTYSHMGILYFQMKNYEKAEEFYHLALEIRINKLGMYACVGACWWVREYKCVCILICSLFVWPLSRSPLSRCWQGKITWTYLPLVTT